MNADGSGQRNLTRNPGSMDWGPAWSPDGRRIVWNSDPGGIGTFRAYLMDPDGNHVRKVPADIYVEYPDWSPDGCKIAFMGQEAQAAGDDPDYNIFVMDADGSNVVRLTDIRLTCVAFGLRSPEALIALAMFNLGGHMPVLPGRTRLGKVVSQESCGLPTDLRRARG